MVRILALSGMVVAAAVSVPSDASALSFTTDNRRVYVDDDKEKEVKVKVSKGSSQNNLEYGYFLNDSKDFKRFDYSSDNSFHGGDSIDLALYNPSKSKYYKLSDSGDDNSYDVEVALDEENGNGNSGERGYKNAHVNWAINDDSNSHELVLCFPDGNNGSTAVPEPATLFLLGSGLLGYAFLSRKKKG